MAIEFEVQHTEGLSRLGTLTTPHGKVQTPALLPVINPNLDLVPASRMQADFGVQMVITNSYIIRKSEAHTEKARAEGVQALIGFDGPVMTDSGTFQDYVYGDVDVKPAEIVAFQRSIGTDIGTILDVFSTPDRTHDQAEEDLTETTRRARDTIEHAGEMAVALPVQGATFPDLRAQAAAQMREIAPQGGAIHPIGGVVPLMEQQRYQTLAQVILGAKRGLHPGRAVHLFGAGHPHMLPLAAYLGCDLFDSAAYAKFAQGDRLLFPWGTEDLADLDALPCACPACRSWTPAELREARSGERKRALAEHNLHATFTELKRVREAQARGRLFDLVLERAMGHPALLEAVAAIREHVEQIEAEEPTSYKRALNLQPAYHEARSQVHRAQTRIRERTFPRGPPVLLDETRRPFAENAPHLVQACLDEGLHPFFPTRLGPVPYALDAVYPFTQSVEPPLGDLDAIDQRQRLAALAKAWQVPVADLPEDLEPAGEVGDLDTDRVRATLAYQFGREAPAALLDGEVELVKSPRTGKLRNVLVDGDHVLSLRAHDGLFTLKLPGADRLHQATGDDRFRLRVREDSAPFNADGKSVFGGFVTAVDPGLRPGDECLVVDPQDRLLGCGRLTVSVPEALALTSGQVAKVREGVGRQALDDAPEA